jgi:hypothetical protein
MVPILFNKELHWEQVSKWLSNHNSHIDEQYLSPIGLIIPDHCASFLILTNTSLAMIEPTIANTALDYIVRNEALNILGDTMWKLAIEYGVKKIIGTSHLPAIISRAKQHGFIISPDTLFYKDI